MNAVPGKVAALYAGMRSRTNQLAVRKSSMAMGRRQ